MKINTKQIENLILNEAISAYSLADELSISRTTISNYRNGTSDIENMSVKNAQIIQEFINNSYNMSYDYTELIKEFKYDYETLDNIIIVVREYSNSLDYGIIVDYGNLDELSQIFNDDNLEYTLDKKENILKEMIEWNSLIKEEIKMNVNNIDNLDYIWGFDDLGDFLNDDQNFTSQDDFEWWKKLANALAYLEGDQGIDTINLEINELQDYIDLAEEKGF